MVRMCEDGPTGSSAAWLTRLDWDQEAAVSNPAFPTEGAGHRSSCFSLRRRSRLLFRHHQTHQRKDDADGENHGTKDKDLWWRPYSGCAVDPNGERHARSTHEFRRDEVVN